MSDTELGTTSSTPTFAARSCSRARVPHHDVGPLTGGIINISSVSGLVGERRPDTLLGVQGRHDRLTVQPERELAQRNHVNAVAPGFIESEMTRVWGDASLSEAKEAHSHQAAGDTAGSWACCGALGQPGGVVRHRPEVFLTVDGGMTGRIPQLMGRCGVVGNGPEQTNGKVRHLSRTSLLWKSIVPSSGLIASSETKNPGLVDLYRSLNRGRRIRT